MCRRACCAAQRIRTPCVLLEGPMSMMALSWVIAKMGRLTLFLKLTVGPTAPETARVQVYRSHIGLVIHLTGFTVLRSTCLSRAPLFVGVKRRSQNWRHAGAVLRLGGGVRVPPIHLFPQIQKLADRSDVISEVSKCSKIQIFWGSVPDPAGGAYSSLPPPKNPTPLSALRASFLQLSGSNPLQSWQPY